VHLQHADEEAKFWLEPEMRSLGSRAQTAPEGESQAMCVN